ncbi:EAL domain-containing protein (plasmid) [Burkholderia sp. JSH-S8]|nr:EAL domain-containing protein [Burkholderia sp. JSH-S8]
MRHVQRHHASTGEMQPVDAGLYGDLHVALSRNELFVVYQPIVDVASNVVVSHEALVRWQHPTRGLVMPGSFIELAERTGLVLGITKAVLEQVCGMLATRRGPGLPVSVNLSAACLSAGGVPNLVRAVLERFGVSSNRLILEITETATLESSDRVMDQIATLRETGVDIVMDDFGTGYSSLVNLWRYPINGLKVDRSFSEHIPHDERMCAIVGSIIEIARRLELSFVIEGIENAQQARWLRQFPNVLAQGYLFGRPVVATAMDWPHSG